MARPIHDLLQWASCHKTTVHDAIQIYRDPVTGLSFRATEDIPPGATLVNCSYDTMLSYLNAIGTSSHFTSHGSEPFPPGFLEQLGPKTPHIIGYFFLIQQYLMGEKSFWYKYIRILPQPDQLEDFGLPIFWSEEDQKFLAGTNAEPPIKQKLDLWHSEWSRSMTILQPLLSDWFKYTHKLYCWAASIFGTRSFRASLTLPPTIPAEKTTSPQQWAMYRDHILKDNFSVLLPVLDIGNHDGINRVEWSKCPASGHFALTASQKMDKGIQIFNYYGSKSNSELLVGYGFLLPTMEQDIVNFRMTPTPEAGKLRRGQTCHKKPTQTEEEFMFPVRRQTRSEEGSDEIIGLQIFPHGLFELLICMVANDRERHFLEQQNPEYCVESSPDMFAGPLYKALFLALQILTQKLEADMKSIEDVNARLPAPRNRYQEMASEYRHRQVIVLEEALNSARQHLQLALAFPSFHELSSKKLAVELEDDQALGPRPAGLLTLEGAFDWLQLHYPQLHDSVVRIIAEDQEESIPLKWQLLVVDWDYSYWIVWIFIVWVLWERDGTAFLKRHPNLSAWVNDMKNSSSSRPQKEVYGSLWAHSTEKPAINHTITKVMCLPMFEEISKLLQAQRDSWEPLRNFASYIAKTETIMVSVRQTTEGQSIDQKVLAISQNKPPEL